MYSDDFHDMQAILEFALETIEQILDFQFSYLLLALPIVAIFFGFIIQYFRKIMGKK